MSHEAVTVTETSPAHGTLRSQVERELERQTARRREEKHPGLTLMWVGGVILWLSILWMVL